MHVCRDPFAKIIKEERDSIQGGVPNHSCSVVVFIRKESRYKPLFSKICRVKFRLSQNRGSTDRQAALASLSSVQSSVEPPVMSERQLLLFCFLLVAVYKLIIVPISVTYF